MKATHELFILILERNKIKEEIVKKNSDVKAGKNILDTDITNLENEFINNENKTSKLMKYISIQLQNKTLTTNKNAQTEHKEIMNAINDFIFLNIEKNKIKDEIEKIKSDVKAGKNILDTDIANLEKDFILINNQMIKLMENIDIQNKTSTIK
jgi:uncharacterized protein YaaN involved in tellurite resistance